MAKKNHTWMPTKEGGSKASFKTRNDGTQGWSITPLTIVGRDTLYSLHHCRGNPDYASSGSFTMLTRKHGIKSNTKRTAEPLNPSIGQGCSFSLTEVMNTAQCLSLKQLVFASIEDAQTFAEETLHFSMTTVCV